jgi:hypothetical protein
MAVNLLKNKNSNKKHLYNAIIEALQIIKGIFQQIFKI